jgi:dTMP kinase
MDNYFHSLEGKELFRRAPGARFIAFEGPDGSGQSTQTHLLETQLSTEGVRIIMRTKEPTLTSKAARKIQEVLHKRQEIDPLMLQGLFTEDRREHLDGEIIPALKNGATVIADRYFFSTFAFGSLECDLEELIDMNKEFVMPDLTIILDVDPAICLDRIRKRAKEIQFFESVQKLKKVRETYKKLAERYPPAHLINGEESKEEVHRKIVELLKENGIL